MSEPEEKKLLAVARPAVYIDVILQSGKQVYEVEVARELHKQLGMALAALDATPIRKPPASKKKRVKRKSRR